MIDMLINQARTEAEDLMVCVRGFDDKIGIEV